MNRERLTRRLAKRGYQILTAMDGDEGIALAAKELPDLILMDMSLPGLDGWEATRELRSRAETKAIPVIALTAHALADDRNRAMEAGFVSYSSQPASMARVRCSRSACPVGAIAGSALERPGIRESR